MQHVTVASLMQCTVPAVLAANISTADHPTLADSLSEHFAEMDATKHALALLTEANLH